MKDDIQALTELNEEIGAAEDRGDRKWFERILAPRLAFLRADGETFDDRLAFLQRVKAKDPSEDPRTTQIIPPIEVIGDRAIVKCIVTQGTRKSHNLRLFIRRKDGPSEYGGWQLVGWANEPS